MRLAVDFHDTLTAYPAFFMRLLSCWPGHRFVLTGAPESERPKVIAGLAKLDFLLDDHYDGILMGFEFDRAHVSKDHFEAMREWKLMQLRENDITVMFDDNPVYVDYLRNQGIAVFQPALSDEYLAGFSTSNPHYTCHFQKGQFLHTEAPV